MSANSGPGLRLAQTPERVKGGEASKPQRGRLLRATTVAPNASSASASVCGSGTRAATSPGRTATSATRTRGRRSKRIGVDISAVEESIHRGTAFAKLAADYRDADKMRIEGSPSLAPNEGRQKLYGDAGFRTIKANIQELLRAPNGDQARWRRSPSAFADNHDPNKVNASAR